MEPEAMPTNLDGEAVEVVLPGPLEDPELSRPGEPHGSLQASAAQGVKWSFIGTLTSQGVRLATSFVLARILGPGDYGVVALAYVYLSLVTVLINESFG